MKNLKKIPIFFGNWAGNLKPFVQISLGWAVKIAFYLSIGKFWRNFFWKKIILFRLWTKFFRRSVERFWCGCQNSILRNHRTFWVKVICSWNSYIFSIIFVHWVKILRNFVKNNPVCTSKLPSSCTKKYFQEVKFSKKIVFPILSGQWAKTFWPFFGKKTGQFVKTVFYVPLETFWWKIFSKEIFVFFSTFSDEILAFCRNFFGWVVKTASYVSRGKFRGKTFFSNLFRILRDKVYAFRRQRSAGLSKRPSSSPKDYFDELSFEKNVSWFFSDIQW